MGDQNDMMSDPDYADFIEDLIAMGPPDEDLKMEPLSAEEAEALQAKVIADHLTDMTNLLIRLGDLPADFRQHPGRADEVIELRLSRRTVRSLIQIVEGICKPHERWAMVAAQRAS